MERYLAVTRPVEYHLSVVAGGAAGVSPWRRVWRYMAPTLALGVIFNLPKFFEFVTVRDGQVSWKVGEKIMEARTLLVYINIIFTGSRRGVVHQRHPLLFHHDRRLRGGGGGRGPRSPEDGPHAHAPGRHVRLRLRQPGPSPRRGTRPLPQPSIPQQQDTQVSQKYHHMKRQGEIAKKATFSDNRFVCRER